MEKENAANPVTAILSDYQPGQPQLAADALRQHWLTFDTNQGIMLIKAEQREQQETSGTTIPALKSIGDEIARAARKNPAGYLPLAQLLWDSYGREGRVIALMIFGSMELAEPETIVPILRQICRGCISWEEADRLAMDALEPVVRKEPGRWLQPVAGWLDDENKWVRRAGVTVIGRLPMKHPAYTAQCLGLADRLLLDEELDVKRAVSFAVRMCARSDPALVRDFLALRVPPPDPAATWVLCDIIRSMGSKIIPTLAPLGDNYRAWLEAASPGSPERRSIESALKVMQAAS